MKNIYFLLCLSLSAVITTITTLAQTHVHTATNFKTPATATVSQAFPGPSTTGNLIVVHLSWDNQARSVSTVTDSKGNTYARIHGPTNWNGALYRSELWYAFDITGAAAITVTATLTGNSTSFFQIYISEYSGIDIVNPLDQDAVAKGSTLAVSSGAKTTTKPNELIYGVSIGSNGILSTGAGFAQRSNANQNLVEDKVGATAGSYSTTFTNNTALNNWVAEMATFKPLINLPVLLLNFDALATNEGTVKLDWATSTETNNDYFEVQHSRDGIAWAVADKVDGKGSLNNTVQYTTTDNSPYPGLSFYRLAQFDFDGRVTYSKVLSVQINTVSEKMIRVYPIPADSYLTVEGDYTELRAVGVVNVLGQWMNDKVQVTRESDTKITLNLSLLPKGVYYLKTKTKSAPFYKR